MAMQVLIVVELLLISIGSSSSTLLRRDRPSILQNDQMLASHRSIIESNPTNGENRFPAHSPFTGQTDRSDPITPPPLPFQPMTADAASHGISAVDTGHSFPLGAPLINGEGYPLTATPPPGIPNMGGVPASIEDNMGDNTA